MKMENYQKIKDLSNRINSIIKELSNVQDSVLVLRDEHVISKDEMNFIIHELNDSSITAHRARDYVFNLQMKKIDDELLKLKQD